MTEKTIERHRLTPQQRRTVQDWIERQGSDGLVAICEEESTRHPLDVIVDLVRTDTGVEATRFNVARCAADVSVTIPSGRPGRPRTRTTGGVVPEALRCLAIEVRRLCRVLDIEPVDAAAVDRICGRT